MPQLRVGHVQVWRTSGDTVGYIVEPRKVADTMTLDNDLAMPMGNTPGVALLGVSRSKYGRTQISLCPVEVVAAMAGGVPLPIDDQYLCEDPQGKPLRLAPGETATVRPLKTDEQPLRPRDTWFRRRPSRRRWALTKVCTDRSCEQSRSGRPRL